jgi:predicted RNase H-like HicB family nuclease
MQLMNRREGPSGTILLDGEAGMTPMKTLSAVLTEEDGGYVALCTELDIASQGETIEEAIANLKEAVEGFFETASPEEIKQRLKKPSLFTHIEIACA